MNKEKLIHIILKDIEELKEISEEIKKDNVHSKLETDIALSKATLILQEFQLLKEKYIGESHQPIIETPEKHTFSETKKFEAAKEPTAPAVSEIVEEEPELPREEFTGGMHKAMIILDEDPEEEDANSENGNENNETEEESTEVEDDDTEYGDNDSEYGDDDSESGDHDSEYGDDNTEHGDDNTEYGDEDSEYGDDEDVPSQPEKRTVGDNFHMEKSLNERMGNNNNTLDQKIANSPISSLQAAIGINDRFLFIREMFNNDSELYNATIKRIDSCQDIRQAVEYLSSNFKIKKTETSLRFVELIKRRFAK